MRPRYNIAPAQTIPMIIQGTNQVEFSQWGFIPSWAKNPGEAALPLAHINARLESLADKPTFKTAFNKQRCLIPASGYYEWRTFSNRKYPYFISLKASPLFAFGGIWSTWRSPTGQDIVTCAIITMEAPPFLQKIHQRMPAVISPLHYRDWLKACDKKPVHSMIMPLEENRFELKAVTPRMNHPSFEGKECIQQL